jgi:hypothetical protein
MPDTLSGNLNQEFQTPSRSHVNPGAYQRIPKPPAPSGLHFLMTQTVAD